MTSNLPRYRQRPTGGMPLIVKAGIFMLLPLLSVGGIVMAITDGAPTLTARAEGGSQLPDFETPGTSSTSNPGGAPSGTPTEGDATPSPTDSATPSPTDSATPSPDETGEDDSSSGSGSGDGSGSDSSAPGEDEDLVATTPPREPGERPTSPDDPSTPEDPDPSPEPSEPSDPTEPSEPEPTEDPTDDPTDEPTDDPDAGLPLPILDLSQAEMQMVDAVDEARAEAGCPALRVDPRLTLASRAHSEDMRDRSYYSHVNPDGEGPEERAADKGYTAAVGENLSQGVRSVQQVVRSWEDGGDERDRLMDCSYTSVGVGTERGGLLGLSSWWTLMLGTD